MTTTPTLLTNLTFWRLLAVLVVKLHAFDVPAKPFTPPVTSSNVRTL